LFKRIFSPVFDDRRLSVRTDEKAKLF